jgi:hypothetical protein
VKLQSNSLRISSSKWLCDLFAVSWPSYSLAVWGSFQPHARLAMAPFEKKRFLLPIELAIALAVNVCVAVLSYYAIMMWGLFRG